MFFSLFKYKNNMTVLFFFLYFIENSIIEVIKVIEVKINILKNFYIILPKKYYFKKFHLFLKIYSI